MKINYLSRTLLLLYPMMWGLFLWLAACQLQQTSATVEPHWPNLTSWSDWRIISLLALFCCAGYGIAILCYFDSLDHMVIPNLAILLVWGVGAVVWLAVLYVKQVFIWPDPPILSVLIAASLALSTPFLFLLECFDE